MHFQSHIVDKKNETIKYNNKIKKKGNRNNLT